MYGLTTHFTIKYLAQGLSPREWEMEGYEFWLKFRYDELKEAELFSNLRVEGPIIVRMDGVKFSKYTKAFGSVRDEKIHKALVEAAKELLKYYSCSSAYVSSDEVNVYCDEPPFGGRVEKIVSTFASFLGAHFSRQVDPPGWFDGRVIKANWNSYVLWRLKVTLCNYASKVTGKSCMKALREIEPPELAYGTLIVREEYLKEGFDPMRKKKVMVKRRRLKEISGKDVLRYLNLKERSES